MIDADIIVLNTVQLADYDTNINTMKNFYSST